MCIINPIWVTLQWVFGIAFLRLFGCCLVSWTVLAFSLYYSFPWSGPINEDWSTMSMFKKVVWVLLVYLLSVVDKANSSAVTRRADSIVIANTVETTSSLTRDLPLSSITYRKLDEIQEDKSLTKTQELSDISPRKEAEPSQPLKLSQITQPITGPRRGRRVRKIAAPYRNQNRSIETLASDGGDIIGVGGRGSLLLRKPKSHSLALTFAFDEDGERESQDIQRSERPDTGTAIKVIDGCSGQLNATQFREAGRLLSILPDPEQAHILSRASSFTPSLHPNIDIVRPPSLVFATNDSHTDHIVAIWDMFVREKTLTIVFARYMESYGCGLYEHVNITFSLSLSSVTKQGNPQTGLFNRTVRCKKQKHHVHILKESRYDPGVHRGVSVDAVRICRINLQSPLGNDTITNDLRPLPISTVIESVSVKIDYLGFEKTFPDLIPIERVYPYSYGANATSSQLVVNTMLGDKPRHSMTTLITWLRYHHRLGVQQVFVYLMQPVQWLISAEEVRELNEYISSLESSRGSRLRLTFIDWPALYMKLPAKIQGYFPAACSHLAIIQSNLYRLKKPLYPQQGGRHRVKGMDKTDMKWMIESDLDDYIVTPVICLDSVSEPCRSHPRSQSPLLDYIMKTPNVKNNIAIEFHNRYFYMLPSTVSENVLSSALLPMLERYVVRNDSTHPLHNIEAHLRKHVLPSFNFTFSDLLSASLIVEMDNTLHRYRPKLIYNVEEVMLGGPHRIDVSRVGGKVLQNAGYYLHLLQGVSIGRDIDMIERPGKTSLKELTDKTMMW